MRAYPSACPPRFLSPHPPTQKTLLPRQEGRAMFCHYQPRDTPTW